jgi:urease subunit gamma/beta
VRFEPGETKTVALVTIAGNQIIRGGNALADGKVSAENQKKTLAAVRDRGFGDEKKS